MQVLVYGRGQGKTTKLVQWIAEEEDRVLVVPTQQDVERIVTDPVLRGLLGVEWSEKWTDDDKRHSMYGLRRRVITIAQATREERGSLRREFAYDDVDRMLRLGSGGPGIMSVTGSLYVP